MIYMEPSQLGWTPLVHSWMKTLPEPLQTPDNSTLLQQLFDWLLPPALNLLRKHCRVHFFPFTNELILAISAVYHINTLDYLWSCQCDLRLTFVCSRVTYNKHISVSLLDNSSAFQEVIPTSNSNTVVSLTRLFEILLAEPLKEDPGNKNIRTWIMVL